MEYIPLGKGSNINIKKKKQQKTPKRNKQTKKKQQQKTTLCCKYKEYLPVNNQL